MQQKAYPLSEISKSGDIYASLLDLERVRDYSIVVNSQYRTVDVILIYGLKFHCDMPGRHCAVLHCGNW